MTTRMVDTGLLLPLASLGLIGAGSEGAHALSLFGLRTPDFESDLNALEDRLRTVSSLEARAQETVVKAIVLASRNGVAWMSLQSTSPSVAPLLGLIGPDSNLVVVLHGDVVEWVDTPGRLSPVLVRAFLAADPNAEARLTVFSRGDALVSIRLQADEADVAAKEPERLERLSVGARQGLDELCAVIAAEVDR